MKDSEFKQPTTRALVARAANRCSNPDCLALTSGPSSEASEAINVGEAAHIYGGKPGSARYNPDMTDQERADPTNGIWLCRTCHKKIDDDPKTYPADLLFEWKREHEAQVLSRIGKASDMRIKVQERMLSKFPEAGYLSQQTILEKPEFWEYKLTAQLLRELLEPLQAQARYLSNGYYALSLQDISASDCIPWTQMILAEVERQVNSIERLVNDGFLKAWGLPGIAGDADEIYSVCTLLRDACARCIAIEEKIIFTYLPESFRGLSETLRGMLSPTLERVFSIAPWVSSIFSQENPRGEYALHLKFELPSDFPERLNEAFKAGIEAEKKRR